MDSGIKLLGYIASALFLFMSIMLLLTMRQSGNMRGARPWLWSTVIAAFGIALNTSQESLPPFLSFVLGNTLIVVGAAVSALGTRDYRLHRPLPWQPLAGLALAISLIIAFHVYIIPSNAIRALVVAVPTALICLWHIGLLLAGSPVWPGARGVVQRRFRLPHAIMALGLLMVAGVFVARGAETAILLARGITELPPSGAPQTVFLVYSAGLCGRLLLLIGMVVVIFDELNNDLRALASRDTLTGLFNRRGFTEAAASLASAPGSQRFDRGDVYMPLTPMFHVHAWGLPYVATLLGVKQVYPGRYVPDEILALRAREGVTFSHCVPTILQMLLLAPSGRDMDLSGWKMVIGGSALTAGLATQAVTRGLDLFAGYGMSETCPILTLAQLRPEVMA